MDTLSSRKKFRSPQRQRCRD